MKRHSLFLPITLLYFIASCGNDSGSDASNASQDLVDAGSDTQQSNGDDTEESDDVDGTEVDETDSSGSEDASTSPTTSPNEADAGRPLTPQESADAGEPPEESPPGPIIVVVTDSGIPAQPLDAGSPPEGQPTPTVDCSSLPEMACGGRCKAIYSVDDQFYACIDGDVSCDQAITCGESPEGEQVTFPSGCLPPGWTECAEPVAVPVECQTNADCSVCPFNEPPDESMQACMCRPCNQHAMPAAACAALTQQWQPHICAPGDVGPICQPGACPTMIPSCVEGICTSTQRPVGPGPIPPGPPITPMN